MPEQKDDPRQVLAILNSLGYVGITAQVLKAFMKDLKLLRKIKERERQQWREEMKRKIFFKQQKALAELLHDSPRSDVASTLSSNDSVVKIKIKCVSTSDYDDNDENCDENQQTRPNIQRYQSPSPSRQRQPNELKKESLAKCKKTKINEQQKLKKEAGNRKSRKSESEIINSLSDHTHGLVISEKVPKRSRSKSITSESTCTPHTNRQALSRSSSHSHPKSFIRPWTLRSDTQGPPQQTKSDPVMLYQKYQKDWKKFPLPGENLHTRIRWEIREKMLGTYPMPRPILKKSFSTMSVKRR
ncbi:uncharacterized protein Hyls1 [Chelonus insularis]|uniref:uncharacterized protein Hyls1 n=1 Tax=Chelonus insularis TaxID=460826 RepID=UPI00158B5E07|nr:uncharacterized protein LOC118073385 [Chelonus insularis]